MSLLKDASIETIRRMPEDSTAKDIKYEIDLVDHVLQGLKDVKEGRTITTEGLLKDIDEWSKHRN